mgnify:CR=1 FL=1
MSVEIKWLLSSSVSSYWAVVKSWLVFRTERISSSFLSRASEGRYGSRCAIACTSVSARYEVCFGINNRFIFLIKSLIKCLNFILVVKFCLLFNFLSRIIYQILNRWHIQILFPNIIHLLFLNIIHFII